MKRRQQKNILSFLCLEVVGEEVMFGASVAILRQ